MLMGFDECTRKCVADVVASRTAGETGLEPDRKGGEDSEDRAKSVTRRILFNGWERRQRTALLHAGQLPKTVGNPRRGKLACKP